MYVKTNVLIFTQNPIFQKRDNSSMTFQWLVNSKYDWFKTKLWQVSDPVWIIKQSDKTKEFVTENANKSWNRAQGSLHLLFT